MFRFVFFIWAPILLVRSTLAQDRNNGVLEDIGGTCKETFPQVIIQAIDVPTRSNPRLIFLNITNCNPAVVSEKSVSENSSFASDASNTTICSQSPGGPNQLSCQTAEGATIFDLDIPPGDDSSEKSVVAIGNNGRNLFWLLQTRNGSQNLMVSDLQTKASVRFGNLPSFNASFTAMDAIHGILFAAVQPNSLWRVKLKTSGSAFEIQHTFTADGEIQTGLAVDWEKEQVFYGYDAKIIRLDYNGGDRDIFDSKLNYPLEANMVPGSVTYFDSHVFYLRGNSAQGYNLSKLDWRSKLETSININMAGLDIQSMQIYENFSMPSYDNPCNELQCSHVCLPFSEPGSQCQCPAYLRLINGTQCSGPDVAIVVEDTNAIEGIETASLTKNTSILVQSLSESSLPLAKAGARFYDVDENVELISTLEDNDICFRKVGSGFYCLGDKNDTVDHKAFDELDNPEAKVQRKVLTSTYKTNGSVFIFNNASNCVQILNSKTGNVWDAFCSSDLNPSFIAVDPRQMALLWVGKESRELRYSDLAVNTTRVLALPLGTTSVETEVPGNICVNPATSRVTWRDDLTLRWLSYDGRSSGQFQLSNSTSFAGSLQCRGDWLYWIERSQNSSYIAAYKLGSDFPDRVVKSDAGTTFKSFSLVGEETLTSSGGPPIDPCRDTPCSHGCLGNPAQNSSSTSQIYMCFCPEGFVLADETTCQLPEFLVAFRSTDSTSLEVISSGNSTSAFEPIQFNFNNTGENLAFDQCSGSEGTVTCWIDTETQVVQCNSTGPNASIIGTSSSTNPQLKLSRDCKRLYWSSDNNGCFKLTTLSNNKTFSFPCLQIDNGTTVPVAMDTERSLLFWCINNAIQHTPVGPSNENAIHNVIPGMRETETCQAMTIDEDSEALYVVFPSKIVKIPYESFKLPVPLKYLQNWIPPASYQSIVYANGGLQWLQTSDGGNLIMYFPYDLVFSTHPEYFSPSPSQSYSGDLAANSSKILYQSSEGRNLTAFQPLKDWRNGTVKEPVTSCSRVDCSGFCYSMGLPLHDQSLVKIGCKCSDDSITQGDRCLPTPSKAMLTNSLEKQSLSSTMLVVVITGSVISFLLLCSLSICGYLWLRKRQQRRKELMKLLKGKRVLLRAQQKLTDLSSLIENMPFTKILPPLEASDLTSEVLGVGHFGIVYRGVLRGSSTAIKTLKKKDDHALLCAMIREIKVMEYVGYHDHVVDFHGADVKRVKRGEIYVFLELSRYGSLEKHLWASRKTIGFAHENGPFGGKIGSLPGQGLQMLKVNSNSKEEDEETPSPFPMSTLFSWAVQIASGMAFLENKGVVHGGLATRNILVFENDLVKISDVGVARKKYQYQCYLKGKPTPVPWRWAAIETLEMLEFTSKSDVWAYGVTLWEIFSLGKLPFQDSVWDDEFVRTLYDGMRLEKPNRAPQSLYEKIMIPSWNLNPDDRPKFMDICDTLEELEKELDVSKEASQANVSGSEA